VLTQPDRPAGRGLKTVASPVKEFALAHGLPVRQPSSLRDSVLQQTLAAEVADVWVVAAYGLILPRAVLDIPRLGCLNIHASLLPRWRGAAPIQRALLAGDAETGISIMRMDEGLDTGPVYLRRSIRIGARDTAGSLHDALAALGAELICDVLDRLAHSAPVPHAQPAEGVTHAAKIDKRAATLDWTQSADDIDRFVRAFDPVPGAHTTLAGNPVKIWRARPGAAAAGTEPGVVLRTGEDGIEVACGSGSLVLEILQRAGGRRLAAAEFLRGFPVAPGARFGT